MVLGLKHMLLRRQFEKDLLGGLELNILLLSLTLVKILHLGISILKSDVLKKWDRV